MAFEQGAAEATFLDYLHEVDRAGERIKRLEQAIDEAVEQAPEDLRAVIDALQALRGIAKLTATTIVAEVGLLSRFDKAKQLMGYAGLVPSENSSGGKRRQGAITKTGNAHLRRVLGEAAWSCRRRPNIGYTLRKRQEGLSEEVKAIAWKAQHRLYGRYTLLRARDKQHNVIITAIARELLGFVWSVGVQAERQHAERHAA
jgi:transposase